MRHHSRGSSGSPSLPGACDTGDVIICGPGSAGVPASESAVCDAGLAENAAGRGAGPDLQGEKPGRLALRATPPRWVADGAATYGAGAVLVRRRGDTVAAQETNR